MTERFYLLAGVVCLVFGIVIMGEVIFSLFEPPPWNRVERFLQGFAWLYVAYLHWQLFKFVQDQRLGRTKQ